MSKFSWPKAERLLDAAEGAEAVAVAALNLAIGLNVNAPTSVAEAVRLPPFTQSLASACRPRSACAASSRWPASRSRWPTKADG